MTKKQPRNNKTQKALLVEGGKKAPKKRTNSLDLEAFILLVKEKRLKT